ncbi:hypothetical protein ALQ18_03762 [Pseudomonas marginalis pv. marginalis]|nr:hypothetical protein ALQ18_03762 [Pseudomonas marginalis pv. marginalis]
MMEAVTGTIKFYSEKTGQGLIALDCGEDAVCVDLEGSAGVRLKDGLRVRFARIHRPKGVFASNITVI